MEITTFSSVVSLCLQLVFCNSPLLVDRGLKRRQVKPLAASLLDALDYDSSDDSDFEVGDASGKHRSKLIYSFISSHHMCFP